MKTFWLIFPPLLILTVGVWYVLDSSSRYNFNFQCPNPGDVKLFNRDTTQDIRLRYQKFAGQKRFKFPRGKVSKIIIRRNIPFVSILTSRTLTDASQKTLLKFLNNPENFDWQDNDMRLSQADYILYFYYDTQQFNGKLWLCTSCKTLKAIPFSPNMKFGHIKKDKWPVLKKILGLCHTSSS